ncbi:Ganglioside GM2 activator precursor, putative [Entamoeba dispar SAW760]|uniref:Ganglioside GM2 activator, putative n=1 Tax=Entamoeba dispar (strain ATCC PRA-260 / SAW760) TaxID=370354 RepID=B0EJF2_ENTDS|nr:Ganglioside GM2 activator precursor, putative [Entamoeba dispar SAW760]EDR25347.1 Ganglioside GM2 activator precursor, putative [Entamoeba dispar SAW760]|eukprot:EDR25347.1 Ganglioside GM2 activator precursor, putative [Entamoeba dispar SAW760]
MFALILGLAVLASAKTYPFTLTSCSKNPTFIIHQMTIQPDNPINIQGGFTLSFDAEVTKEITEASVALTFQKEVLFWVTIPCTKNVGSCTYNSICDLFANVTNECLNATRSHGFDKVPCSCPIPVSRYTASIPIPPLDIPDGIEWLASGNYKIKMVATDPTGAEISCYDAKFSLSTK